MKPREAPDVPGKTPSERMSNALRMVLKVPKKELLRKEESEKRSRPPKRQGKTD